MTALNAVEQDEGDDSTPDESDPLIGLMRVATDGSGSFMSRRARQILWENFRIAVVTSVGIYTAKASHFTIVLERLAGVISA